MADRSSKTELQDQQRALMSYLETLLLEVEQRVDAETETDSASTASEIPAPAENLDRPAEPATPVIEQAAAESRHQGRAPDWASFPMQVLTFEISGILYAAALDCLHGILPMPTQFTHIPTKIEWFLGLFRNRDINVKLIDLEKIWQKEQHASAGADPEFVMLIDEGRFGFTATKVKTIKTLYEENVQWRHPPALEGIMLGHLRDNMANLLDINALINGLRAGTWAGSRS